MTNRMTTITAAETRRRKAALEAILKDVLGVAPEREELQIEFLPVHRSGSVQHRSRDGRPSF